MNQTGPNNFSLAVSAYNSNRSLGEDPLKLDNSSVNQSTTPFKITNDVFSGAFQIYSDITTNKKGIWQSLSGPKICSLLGL